MRRSFLFVLMFCGCGVQPGPSQQSTGIRAGLYTGSILCETSITDPASGESDVSQDSMSWDATFNSKGRIIFQGDEILVGDQFGSDFSGFSRIETVTDVSYSNNGVVVTFDILVSLEIRGEVLEFSGQGSETYRRINTDEVEVTRTVDASASDGIDLIFLFGDCTGELTR